MSIFRALLIEWTTSSGSAIWYVYTRCHAVYAMAYLRPRLLTVAVLTTTGNLVCHPLEEAPKRPLRTSPFPLKLIPAIPAREIIHLRHLPVRPLRNTPILRNSSQSHFSRMNCMQACRISPSTQRLPLWALPPPSRPPMTGGLPIVLPRQRRHCPPKKHRSFRLQRDPRLAWLSLIIRLLGRSRGTRKSCQMLYRCVAESLSSVVVCTVSQERLLSDKATLVSCLCI